MRVFAIGDIHGCLTALQTLDKHLQFGPADLLITLGDYIDRGPQSSGVLEHLIGLRTRTNLIPILGNHEIMMLESRHNSRLLQPWLANGGGATLASYEARSFDDIPASHWEFMESCHPYHELDEDFFVHANTDPKLPLNQQNHEMLFWEHLDNPKPHVSGRRMICGHTSQKSGKVFNLGHILCIDTWACGTGWLTCLNPNTGEYWQANQQGELHELHL